METAVLYDRGMVELAEHVIERPIAELQAGMAAGDYTSVELVEAYFARIEALDANGPKLNSVIERNPDALKAAKKADADRKVGRWRGPLHGIPILLKDNIDTGDKMLTTAGSLALTTSMPAKDSFVAARMRFGAVILGKTNLSEWANFRSSRSISGWSGRGGQTLNPYVLDRTPSGSSSGSGVAAAANLSAACIGTETDGSIVSPANANGIVGVKPTVGLVSRAGIIPIAASQDTAGPMARTVADAAAILGYLTGEDERDSATAASKGKRWRDYVRFLRENGLKGARIGVARQYTGFEEQTEARFEDALRAMKDAGAVIVDPVTIPNHGRWEGELLVMMYEIRRDLAAYLATRVPHPKHKDVAVPTGLADLIAFNREHAAEEMPLFQQEIFERALALETTDAEYLQTLSDNRRLAGAEAIDLVMEEHRLDAIVAPTGGPAMKIGAPPNRERYNGGCSWLPAMAGYPIVSVPMGFAGELPVNVSFFGRAWSEPVLLRLGYAYEQATRLRRAPRYLASVE